MNSDDINKQVKEYLKKGGKIKKIPAGLSTESTINKKKPLFGLSKPGFHQQKIVLNEKGKKR